MLELKEYFIKLLLSAILGGLIGLERDVRGKAAGLRTHILVALGSTLFMLVSMEIYTLYRDSNSDSVLRIDPARVAAQIIAGIGFIGAGAVIRNGIDVRGLTTAGCIWVCAGVGMAVGVGNFYLASFATFVALFSLLFLNKVEQMYFKDSYVKLDLIFDDYPQLLDNIKLYIKNKNLDLRLFEFEKDIILKKLKISIVFKLKFRTRKNFYLKTFIADIERDFVNDLKFISWKEPTI